MGRVECEKNYLIVALVVLGICYFELRWSLKEMGGVFVFGVVVLGSMITVLQVLTCLRSPPIIQPSPPKARQFS